MTANWPGSPSDSRLGTADQSAPADRGLGRPTTTRAVESFAQMSQETRAGYSLTRVTLGRFCLAKRVRTVANDPVTRRSYSGLASRAGIGYGIG
jgi:hypothetical protein